MRWLAYLPALVFFAWAAAQAAFGCSLSLPWLLLLAAAACGAAWELERRYRDE